MIDVDELKQKLGASEHRKILERCGFDLIGEPGDKLEDILGPQVLGGGRKEIFPWTSRLAE